MPKAHVINEGYVRRARFVQLSEQLRTMFSFTRTRFKNEVRMRIRCKQELTPFDGRVRWQDVYLHGLSDTDSTGRCQ